MPPKAEVGLMEIWVKAPILHGSDILVASRCLKYVAPEIYEKLADGKVVLLHCPENENVAVYGKLASIIRSSKPKSVTVVTVDGSPHCLQLHAAVNEALYILGEKIPQKHYVVRDAKELIEISPDAVRVARYLSIVDKVLKEKPTILEELKKHSLEYRKALETK